MSDSENNKPGENSVKEQIKFAVVMYGGGSLAIYINGVAQELLKMVQATSDTQHPREVEEKEEKPILKTVDVYRKIAFLLSDKKTLTDFSRITKIIAKRKENLLKPQDESLSSAEKDKKIEKLEIKLKKSIARHDRFNEKLRNKVLSSAQPSVKFVIDVLTGSSAGGINAVYLSKALVNGVDGMDDLQKLWIEQGDFAKLLNDKKSVADNQLNLSAKPASLLNSQRMYLELLKALDEMDERADIENPMVEELDLFVTYTDFRGVPLPMFLSDKEVLERRHKHVFNFRYMFEGINDFTDKNNPFLAFAARTTSSFPFAFEPSCLKDVDEVLANSMSVQEKDYSKSSVWKKYFRDLTDENGKAVEWENRSFVDGGALDNKPFAYAIDKLTQRADEGIVHRKLLYIEPAPEDFSNEKNDTAKPNAIANLLGQGVNLPRYETIREDLQRLIERNRLIRRTNRITADVERDFEKNFRQLEKIQFPKDFDWGEAGLNDVVKYKGVAFLPYYRLRLSALTDDIAKMATAHFRFDRDSNYFNVLRSLIAVWRDNTFLENSTPESKKGEENTVNKFLYLYDVEYRFRRLRFIMRRIENLLHNPNKTFKKLLEYTDQEIERLDGEITKATNEEDNKTTKNIESSTSTIEKESGTAAETATERTDGLVSPMGALLKAVPIDKAEEKEELPEKKTLSKLEKLSQEKSELTAKRSVIKNMATSSEDFLDEFFAQSKTIQGEINKVYQHLRREHEYLHTGLENTELSDAILGELERKVSAGYANNSKENLKEFKEKLAAVEEKLQTLEKAKNGGKETDSKKLSLNALGRLLKLLKKEEDVQQDESQDADNKKSVSISAEKAERALKKTYGEKGFGQIIDVLDAAAESLEKLYNNQEPEDYFIRRASSDMKNILNPIDDSSVSDISKIIREYLYIYYKLFDSYDQISFPVYFETSVGEAVEVDIVRISSRDAHSLINEECSKEKRRKLAGDALFNFGAFLDPRWRLNDIMWGRLDGAERLITTLLPDDDYEPLRKVLIDEANGIILGETILAADSPEFRGIVVNSLTLAGAEAIKQKAVDRLVSGLKAEDINETLTRALANSLKKDVIFDQVKTNYEVNRRPDPEPTLKMLSRATQVSGKILEGISKEAGQEGGGASWLAKLGQIFFGLVIVAAPNSFWNLLFVYWLQVLYVFEACLIIGGALLSSPQVQQFGFIAFLVTMIVHLTTLVFHDYMRGKRFLPLILYGVGIIAALLAITGAIFIYAYLYDSGSMWAEMVSSREKYLVNMPRFNKFFPAVILGVFLLSVLAWRSIWSRAIVEIGIVMLVFAAAILGLGLFFYFFSNSVFMSAQFVNNADQVSELVGELGSQMRDRVKISLLVDTFAFVPVYTILFLLLSQLLSFRLADFFKLKIKNESGIKEDTGETFGFKQLAKPTAIFAAFLAVAAAVADCIENYFVYRIMSISTENLKDNSLFERLCDASQAKWIAIFLCVFLLSFIFLRWQPAFYDLGNRFKSVIGFILINLTFLVMLIAPFVGYYELYHEPVGIQYFSIMLLSGGILAGLTMLYYRQRFLVGF